jgi:hypothetical protein
MNRSSVLRSCGEHTVCWCHLEPPLLSLLCRARVSRRAGPNYELYKLYGTRRQTHCTRTCVSLPLERGEYWVASPVASSETVEISQVKS